MNQKDHKRLQELEEFVTYVQVALETYKLLLKDYKRGDLDYLSTMRAGCIHSIKRAVMRLSKQNLDS